MEVIFHENGQGKINLPKNVRQIGTEQGNYRVYIEDYAYSYIKDVKVDEDDDGATGILLGETKEADGITYIFIKGVISATNAAVFTDHIAFTEETWPVIRKYISLYFDGYDIVGWYLCSSKITDKNMDTVNKAHDASFNEGHKVFFMVNSGAGDEAFFEKGENCLVPMTGYTVYFEKNTSMQRYMKEVQNVSEDRYSPKEQSEKKPEEEPDNEGSYRDMVKKGRQSSPGSIKRNLTFIYVLSMLVIIVVLIIGVNRINSFDKMSGLGEGTVQEANGTPQENSQSKTPVTTLEGNVTKEPDSEEQTTSPAATEPSQEPTTEEPTTEEPTTEAEQTYVIQKGDTMWGVCVKFYGKCSEEIINKILSYNGMTSIDEFQIGRTIKIPGM